MYTQLLKVITILCIIDLSCSCSNTRIIDYEKVMEIEVFSIKKGTEYIYAINTVDAVKREGKDSVISDRDFIQQFVSYLNVLKEDKNDSDPSGDFRTAVIIKIMNKHPKTVLFGEHFGTVYQGKKMIDNKELFEYIDEKIYGPHPYEWWLTEQEKTIHRNMKIVLDSETSYP